MTALPSHVLVTTDAVGGVWTYALDLAEGLQRRGVKATLAVIGPEAGESQRADAAARGVTLIDTGFPLDWWGADAVAITGSGRAIARLARQIDADLVHLHAPSYAAGGSFVMPVVGSCHSCLATWWDAVRGGDMPEDFAWRTDLLASGYRACDQLIAPSRSFAGATAQLYGASPVVVWNGRRNLASGDRRSDRRGVLTSGRLWDDGKDIATLDKAAGRMSAKVSAAGALRGPDGQQVELHHIEVLGQLSAADLAQRLANAAVFASLARYEPFGLGVLEAAQAGCALVLSDIPTFRELWDGAALFVPPQDDAAAATILERLLEEADRLADLGARARERAARFTVEAMVDGVLSVYADVLSSAAPAQGAAA